MNILFELDRQFCTDCQTNKADAWMHYLADDTIMGTPQHQPYITDHTQIQSIMTLLFEREHLSFTWEPVHGELSQDGSLGYTSGTYQRSYQHHEATIHETGKYVTIWRRVKDTYKIVFDMGN